MPKNINNKQQREYLSWKHYFMAAFVLLGVYLVLPFAQNLYYILALSNGDVTQPATVNTSTDITASIANLGTDSYSIRWLIGGAQRWATTFNLPFNFGAYEDLSGNGNTPTNIGTAFETNAAECQVGLCAEFDGTGNYISFPVSELVDTFSTSFWIKPDSNSGNPVWLMIPNAAGTNEVFFGVDPGGTAYRILLNNSTQDIAGNTPTLDSWNHLVLTYDGSNARVYEDTVLIGTLPFTGGLDFDTCDALIGSDTDSGCANSLGNWFDGHMDEFAFYENYVLSQDEVDQLFSDGGAGLGAFTTIPSSTTQSGQTWHSEVTSISDTGVVGTAVSSTASTFVTGGQLQPSHVTINPTNDASNLTVTVNPEPAGSTVAFRWYKNGNEVFDAFWPFNDALGTTEADLSSNEHTGTVTNAVFNNTASGNCQVGGCYFFDGSGDYITIPSAEIVDNASDFTISAWVNVPTFAGSHHRIFSEEYVVYVGYEGTSGNISYYLGNGSSWSNSTNDIGASLTANTWQHVVWQKEGTTARVFLNGVQAGSEIAAPATLGASTRPNCIGTYAFSTACTTGQYWNGYIDELQITRQALPAEQIRKMYEDGVNNDHAFQVISTGFHDVGDILSADAFEIGSVFGPMDVGSVTISAAPAATVSNVAAIGAGPFVEEVNFTFDCDLDAGGSDTRTILVEYTTDGATFFDATIESPSQGTVSGATIEGITCDGSSITAIWDSFADSVALGGSNPNIQLRVSPSQSLSTSGLSPALTVENPSVTTITTTQTMVPGDFASNGIYIFDGNITVTIDQELGDPTINVHSIYLENGADLIHPAGTAVTLYKVDFTASNVISLEAGTSIDTLSRGYPTGESFGGDTLYNHGGLHANETDFTKTYDTPQNPANPGSGGGSGPGGGVILLTTNELSLNGTLSTNSIQNTFAHGAGGSVKITTTGALSGSGSITSNGTTFGNGATAGAGGRIAFYYTNAGGINATAPQDRYTIQAFGGSSSSTDSGAGTIYIEDANAVSQSTYDPGEGLLIINNNNIGPDDSPGTPIAISAPETYYQVLVSKQARLLTRELEVTNLLSLTESATAAPPAMVAGGQIERLILDVSTGSFVIDASSSIDADRIGPVAGETVDTINDIAVVGGELMVHGGITRDSSGPGAAYGLIHDPQFPGNSGGSGPGGGYVRILATDFELEGTIDVNGITNTFNHGAGGGVKIVTTGELTGNGTITASSTTFGNGATSGAGGRIAFYYSNSGGINPTPPQDRYTIQAFGGNSSNNVSGAGTIYIEDAAEVALGTYLTTEALLIVDNSNHTDNDTEGTPVGFGGSDRFHQVIVDDGGHMIAGSLTVTDSVTVNDVSRLTANTLDITNTLDVTLSSTLSHPEMISLGSVERLDVNIPTGTMTVDATSAINVDGKGVRSGEIVNEVGDNAIASASRGSHGGLEENETDYSTVYGSIFTPNFPGSGGDNGIGGGFVSIETNSLNLEGDISADSSGTFGQSRGAGGGVLIEVNDTYSGSGTISAENNSTFGNGAATGGGGRIAFKYTTAGGINSTYPTDQYTFDASGGISSGVNGSAGTTYIENRALHTVDRGDLIIDNKNVNSSNFTPLFFGTTTSLTLNNLSVINTAIALIDNPCNGANSLTVLGSIDLSGGGSIVNNIPGTCTTSIPSVSLPNQILDAAEVGQAYTDFVEAEGGYSPYSYACLDGVGGSVVACNTVLPAWASLNTSTGEVTNSLAPTAGSTQFAVRATDSNPGGAQTADGLVTLNVTNPPSAPTNGFVHPSDAQSGFATPASGIDTNPVFSAICLDPDGDDCDQYQVQVATDNGFASIIWDSGSSGTSMTATNDTARSPNIAYAGPALTLGGTTYYWRIKFFDAFNAQSPFSSTFEFTTDNAPTAPTLLQSGDTTATLTNPVGLTSETPVFSAIFNDPDLTDTATAYRIQVDNDNDFSSIVWDSGAAGTAMPSCNQGTRCSDIIFGGTPLELNEALYYWRIAFYDAAGVVSPFSEDPISTNTFKMGSGGSSVQRIQSLQNPGGGDGGDPDNQDPEVLVIPQPPVLGSVQVLSSSQIKYNFIDNSVNEAGFRLIDAQGNVLKEVAQSNISSITLDNLSPNSLQTDVFLAAFNAAGQSLLATTGNVTADGDYPDAVTLAPNLVPVAVSRVGTSLGITTDISLNNLIKQKSGLEFELLIPATGQNQQQVISSGFIQKANYTFNNVPSSLNVQVRVKARNQVSVNTSFSNFVTIPAGQFQGSDMTISLNVRQSDTGELPRPIKPNRLLTVTMVVSNSGDSDATNVLLNLPLPPYMRYVSDSISIDGVNQSDGVDSDPGQYTGHTVSTVWPVMTSGQGHIITFQLGFDQDRLKTLRRRMLRPVDNTNERFELNEGNTQGGGLVEAVASLIQTLQGNIGNTESDQIVYSEIWEVEPEIEIYDEEIEEEAGEDLEEIPEDEQDEVIDELEKDFDDEGDPEPLPPNEDSEPENETEEVPAPDEDNDGFPDDIPDDEMDGIQDTIEDILNQEDLDRDNPPSDPSENGSNFIPSISTPDNNDGPGLQPVDPPTVDAIEQTDGEDSPGPDSDTNEDGPSKAPTKTQISGPSFSLETPFIDPDTGEEKTLGVTGFAEEDQDEIKFSGTTTEPFTVVTLIFDSETTAIAVSDSNGNWDTFVSANKLGVQPGQSRIVTVEAIAAKGAVRSERVGIANVVVDRSIRGDIIADFNEETSIQRSFLREIETSVQAVEPQIQTATVVGLPVIIVASAPLWGYLPLLPTLLYHFITLLIGVKKRRKDDTDASVYNAITKEPVALAIVRFFHAETHQLVQTTVTDKLGNYSVLLSPGEYTVSVQKPQYTFPSTIVTQSTDMSMTNVFTPNTTISISDTSLLLPHIPIDPVNETDPTHSPVRSLIAAIRRIGDKLALPLLVIGFVISLILTISSFSVLNILICISYLVIAVVHIVVKEPIVVQWGSVTDLRTNAALPLTAIQLIDTEFGRVVKSRLTDYLGRFSFDPEQGTYIVKASKQGYQQLGEDKAISIQSKGEKIKQDIEMKPQTES